MIEYQPFFPERWTDTRMHPWFGTHIAFLTTRRDFDSAVMARFLERLDAAWELYLDVTGRAPQPRHLLEGRAVVAAVPDAKLTCGWGCGMLGETGIEVAGFYASDYVLVKQQPDAFPHYYFYELGRNFYTFGDRHKEFATGWAVFMRYVCMDALQCLDPDIETRRTIERIDRDYAIPDAAFVGDEKAHRVPGVIPSDQPVLYASRMLRVCKGIDWLKRFHAALAASPELPGDPAGQYLAWKGIIDSDSATVIN